jgi:hypothetical protein
LFCYAGTTKKTSIDLSPLGVGSKHWVTTIPIATLMG